MKFPFCKGDRVLFNNEIYIVLSVDTKLLRFSIYDKPANILSYDCHNYLSDNKKSIKENFYMAKCWVEISDDYAQNPVALNDFFVIKPNTVAKALYE